MAPYAVDTAVAARNQPRRPAIRIVPAIPFAFTRAPASAKRSGPEEPAAEPAAEAATRPAAELHPAVEDEDMEHEKAEELPVHVVQAPPTPDSTASDVNRAPAEEPTPTSSQAAGLDDAREKSLTRVSEQQTQDEETETVEDTPVPSHAPANGEQSPASPPAPAELPPPFYPAERPVAQPTASEDPSASFRPSSAHFPPHHTHPSVEGLVFGGTAHESPAVPSTPHELEQSFTRAPPGFAPPPFPPSFYPGHTHHPSEPAPAPWMYQQFPLVPPESLHSQRREYPVPPFQPGHVAYQGSYQGQFSPPHAPHVLNGTTRSHSQSPNKTHFGGTKPNSDYEEEPHAAPYQNGTNLQSIDTKMGESPFELASYLSAQFGNPEFADFILQIRSEDILLSLPIHGIVVARSPVIAQAIHSRMSTFRTKDSRRLVDILTADTFVTSESLNEAIKVLYGAPLLSVESFLYGLRPFHHDGEQGPTYNEARRRMGQAISYAAAGRALQIRSVQARGIEIIKALLRWDTFDKAIHFGLDGCLPRVPPASRQNGTTPDQPYAGDLDTFEIAPLHDAIEFIAYNFPAPFTLYALAPELRLDPRLPSIVEFRSATHNPRLSRIQFGDAPPQDELKPDNVARSLSSVLVSLPLRFLERLFSHRAAANRLGWTGVVKVMRDVVEEREKRRQKTMKSQLRPMQDGTIPQSLLENLYWEERVEPVEPSSTFASGFKISETRLSNLV
ncbi:hypothetical protein K505DRAFT_364541 [Melanomma pulvis-pyrius CBS 109.77]|uniref:BTB domain-containing protein n=1 Tax=Melanomma pulvis-pyrius CBS 109.77 TaxID=1314802 RepID=A0A6A6X361_9PLEO|nr:hypothetical protein K505DRAFT_364541 [Melanomma pulvis-pyrius CBS 109.77]